MLNTDNREFPSKAYLHLKAKYKKHVLLYRSGTYYLAYGNDAVIVAELLTVPLTTTIDGSLNLAVLPHCSWDECIDILVKNGHTVAMAEEIGHVEPVELDCAKHPNLFDR